MLVLKSEKKLDVK